MTENIFTPGPTPDSVRSTDGKVLTAPEGWILLSPGDAALTRRVKAAGEHWVVQEKKGRKVFSRGVWAAAATIEKIRAELEAERSTEGYAKRKKASALRRDKVQTEYVEDFNGAVVAFLAFHPKHTHLDERLARAVTDHATPVGSGTVARTKRIPVEQRAESAVITWMRHQTTAYESMAIPRVKGNVIAFFAHNEVMLLEHIGPIVEYLRFRKLCFKREPPLPEKRKTVQHLLEKVAKWRHPITDISHSASLRWERLGIGGLEFNEDKLRNPQTWTIRELLDSNELILEGRAMRHCVGSYAGRCVRRGSSIWSMTRYSCLGDEHILTIEINPKDRTIVQAKGKRNSPPSSEARQVILRWARQEGLEMAEWVQ